MVGRTFITIATLFCILHVLGDKGYAQGLLAEKAEKQLIEAANKIELGCAKELNKYCNTVTPGEGRLLFCIMAHEDKIGEKCEYALYEASQNLTQAVSRIVQTADHCWEDIQKFCTSAPLGGGGIARCLVSNASSLTGTCRSSIGELLERK
jgi:Golgi apparatus protein 1